MLRSPVPKIVQLLAEEKGFEPLVGLPLRRFSKPLPSTTRPLLQTNFALCGARRTIDADGPDRRVSSLPDLYQRDLPRSPRPPPRSPPPPPPPPPPRSPPPPPPPPR